MNFFSKKRKESSLIRLRDKLLRYRYGTFYFVKFFIGLKSTIKSPRARFSERTVSRSDKNDFGRWRGLSERDWKLIFEQHGSRGRKEK